MYVEITHSKKKKKEKHLGLQTVLLTSEIRKQGSCMSAVAYTTS